jgi:hypothetical protein
MALEKCRCASFVEVSRKMRDTASESLALPYEATASSLPPITSNFFLCAFVVNLSERQESEVWRNERDLHFRLYDSTILDHTKQYDDDGGHE